jgi:hypothetical protein
MSHYRRTYLRRYYGGTTIPRPVLIAGAAAVVIGAAGATAHHHHGHHQVAPPAISWPAGSYAPQTWAPAFLADSSLPRTPCDVAAVIAWIGAEGSNPGWHNPLDSTMPEPGSSPVNSDGVQSYTSWRQGLAATAATIHNGLYPGILAALAAGNNAQAVAGAVAASPWGTQAFTANC